MLTGASAFGAFIGPLMDSPSKYHNPIPSASGQKILNWFGGVSLGIATVSALTLFAINKYKKFLYLNLRDKKKFVMNTKKHI